MCREMSEEGYRVVSWASSPCRTNFYGGECRTFFRRRKKMFRAENLKRYKGKSSDCGTQSGLFLLYPFSSDSFALHITFFSGNSTHPLLRRNSSAGKDAQDPYGIGEHPGRRGGGDVCVVRCACEAGSGTPEGGGSKSPRGESPPRSQGRHPGNRGKRRMQR